MSYRGRNAVSTTAPRVPLWRVMLVVIGLFWILAVVVFVVTQWVAPAIYSGVTSTSPSGFNYAQSFGVPFIKTWGFWVAVALLVLGPLAAAWRALERGGEAAVGKALGTTSSRRGRR